MLEAGIHFGHQSRRWNPAMKDYLYGSRDGVHIFDLIKTKVALETALDFLTKAAKEGKVILFVGTKRQASVKIEEIAKNLNHPFVNLRWLGGTLSNFSQIQTSIKKLADLKEKVAKGEFKSYTKKERLLIDREIDTLEKKFGGIAAMTKLPDVLFVLDIKKEAGAIKEAQKLKIPVIGVADSNSDPSDVDYPIPANDDAVKAIEYIMELVQKAIIEGQKNKSKPKKETKK